MTLLKKIRALAIATTLGVSTLSMIGGTASASDHCPPKVTYVYKTVCKYVRKNVAYRKLVTRYDECGKPYYAVQTCYKTVIVPVTYKIKVPVYYYTR